VFQAIVSEKPVFAILHEDSDAVDTIKACEAGDVFTFSRAAEISVPALGERLAVFLKKHRGNIHKPNFGQFEPFSARHSTFVLASALNRVSRSVHCG
jgi:hypothetical protein